MKRQGQWWLVASLAVLLGCAPRAPEKPAGLPAQSFWVGTRKSGVFVVVGPQEKDGWRIQAFDDRSGALKVEGLYSIRGLARAELPAEEFKSFDGTNFQLTDGAQLMPKAKP